MVCNGFSSTTNTLTEHGSAERTANPNVGVTHGAGVSEPRENAVTTTALNGQNGRTDDGEWPVRTLQTGEGEAGWESEDCEQNHSGEWNSDSKSRGQSLGCSFVAVKFFWKSGTPDRSDAGFIAVFGRF